jgi:hypothetical protein
MGTTAGTGRAARPLAILAVLIGLLAMHGLSSTHHAAAASPPPHSALPPAASPEADPGTHHQAVARPAAPPDIVAFVGEPGASCDDTCTDLAMLCVAVLTGAALALVLARRRSSPLLPAPARPGVPAPAGPPVRYARGPDPVRELCVSRT